MKNKIELKPCPFCGCKSKIKSNGGECGMIDYNAIVGCVSKRCGVNIYAGTTEKAAEKWNRRGKKKR